MIKLTFIVWGKAGGFENFLISMFTSSKFLDKGQNIILIDLESTMKAIVTISFKERMVKRLIILLSIFFFAPQILNAQIFKKLGKKIEQKVKYRAERKVDESIEKGLDKTEDSAKGKITSRNSEIQNDKPSKNKTSGKSGFAKTTKFDFVPGENILLIDDFSQAGLGDFPAKWWTNGGGEIVKVEGSEEKWFEMKGNFTYFPEAIKSLPENFTMEFDLIYNYQNAKLTYNIFGIYLVASKKDQLTKPVFKYGFSKPGIIGAAVEWHAYDQYFFNVKNWSGGQLGDIDAKTESTIFSDAKGQPLHVALWRQGPRLRMYVNETKIIDVQRLLDPQTTYNQLKFAYEDWGSEGRAYISNLRFAVGAPDLRNKLLAEGKVSTNGILFESNSDHIQAVSYGVIREIAMTLQEETSLRLKVIGYTDSDGDDAFNQKLSQRRAQAVKEVLVKDFKVKDGRLEVEGKGETQPVTDNNTKLGKAANRRVEFVKL